jgi:signal transduction histidine kinase
MEAIAFQARARTIDHLGREQIADCPTAISELWKNSYDAYAQSVHLHILNGDISTAALVDDGHGMSRDEVVEKWLILGTESKATGDAVDSADQNGLAKRKRQGQKGIGRLSAAALGPLMLLVSKRQHCSFVACLVDWRLFQNPFLLLNDIKIPVAEFAEKSELIPLVDSMFDKLMSNVWGDAEDDARRMRLTEAWRKFDQLENSEQKESTRSAIENVLIKTSFTERQFDLWSVWSGERLNGTAMFISDIAFDLEAQLTTGHTSMDEAVIQSARSRLTTTLSKFTDPYRGDFRQPGVPPLKEDFHLDGDVDTQFRYGVTAWDGALNRTIISDAREFGVGNLESLEHIIDGGIDSAGVFKGRVKLFGKWLPEEIVITPPAAPPTRRDSRVGPFSLRLGTFEQELKNTTHEHAVHAGLVEMADKAAGFLVFRDGLRVLPYGREDNDFFDIERRRGMHAGREFWSIRRMFGRVSISRERNPNLKDKAGREGFIDNKAAKVFRDIIENILRTTARRFFGSDAATRKETISEINKNFAKIKAEEAQKKLTQTRRKEFRKNLELFFPQIREIREELEKITDRARSQELPSDESELMTLRATVEGLRERQSQLTLGSAPSKLGTLEPIYKDFRNNALRASEMVGQLRDSISVAIDRVKPKSKEEIAHSLLQRNAAYLHGRIRKWAIECRSLMDGETQRIGSLVEDRNKSYHASVASLLSDLREDRASLSDVLKRLDSEKERQDQENEQLFENYLSTIKALAENIDLQNLVSVSITESIANREEIQRLNSLAQLGITVEIVSHEVSGFDGAIRDGLRRMPDSVKSTDAYRAIEQGHDSLSERLRFLSPLKLSGERSSQWIKGAEIANFVSMILNSQLSSFNIELIHTAAFDRIEVYDQFSRIAPVFVNLVNNSIYWVGHGNSDKRIIQLDVRKDQVIVSDNGPGVEAADISSLFSLFFTRKIRGGRGVGLYLCRANLAAAGHSIEYITEPGLELLPGANFGVRLSGAKYD